MRKGDKWWVGQQNWEDVLFIHIPISSRQLRPFVPYPFEVEAFNGCTWVTIVSFKATSSRARYISRLLSYPTFMQINVRTYVRFADVPGVYFFSVHVSHQCVAFLGKRASLPYQFTQINANSLLRGKKRYELKMNETKDKSTFMNYTPMPDQVDASPDSLAYFLTERYYIWIRNGNKIMKAPVSHSPWNLQAVNVELDSNLLEKLLPCSLSKKNIQFHYCPFKHAKLYLYEKVARYV
ncbi:DUF2071 domain-containing protein [Virgibacillus sp. W0430]|uniref:DUF2071 domain-containing protein n=1 Tax=Virgibacillus sp. W0430 TaxID=3391580 RepID=UPI003F4596C5